MEVRYEKTSWKKTYQEKASIEEFTRFCLICGIDAQDSRVLLEEQPTKVAEAIGRLLDILVRNGLLNKEEFGEILDVDYHKRESLEFVNG